MRGNITRRLGGQVRRPFPVNDVIREHGIFTEDNSLIGLYIIRNQDNVADLIDMSRYGNNGTVVNAVFRGKGIVFDGVDDHLDHGNIVDLATVSSKLTAIVYFEVGAIAAVQVLLGKAQVDAVTRGWQIEFRNDNEIRFSLWPNGTVNLLEDSQTFVVGDKVFIGGTYNGSSNRTGMSLYVNNTFTTGTNLAMVNPITSTSDFIVGALAENVALQELTGSIYFIELHNRELTNSEILRIHEFVRGLV